MSYSSADWMYVPYYVILGPTTGLHQYQNRNIGDIRKTYMRHQGDHHMLLQINESSNYFLTYPSPLNSSILQTVNSIVVAQQQQRPGHQMP